MLPWLAAFAFTQVVECPIYLLALRGAPGPDPQARAWWRRLVIAFGASAITHPVVWFGFPRLWLGLGYPGGYWAMVAAAEAFAVCVEASYVRGFRVPQPWAWSVLANAASFGLGMASRTALGWP
jgi:hypothetical protein